MFRVNDLDIARFPQNVGVFVGGFDTCRCDTCTESRGAKSRGACCGATFGTWCAVDPVTWLCLNLGYTIVKWPLNEEYDDIRNGGYPIFYLTQLKIPSWHTLLFPVIFFTQWHPEIYQKKVRYLVIVALSHPEEYCACVQVMAVLHTKHPQSRCEHPESKVLPDNGMGNIWKYWFPGIGGTSKSSKVILFDWNESTTLFQSVFPNLGFQKSSQNQTISYLLSIETHGFYESLARSGTSSTEAARCVEGEDVHV